MAAALSMSALAISVTGIPIDSAGNMTSKKGIIKMGINAKNIYPR